MGIPHLEKIRNHMKNNPGKRFTKSELRNILNQNFNTVIQNLKYLQDVEKSVERIEDDRREYYQWKDE